jgi:hypothetical protein
VSLTPSARSSSVIDTADHKKSDFEVEYLGEFEFLFENSLTRKSGAQVYESFDEKNRGRKSRDRVPFTGDKPVPTNLIEKNENVFCLYMRLLISGLIFNFELNFFEVT